MSVPISEFAEDVLGIKLTAYQKDFLEKMYDVYEKDPKNFKIDARQICNKRANPINTIIGLSASMIIFDEFYKFENEEVKENE